MKKRNFFILIAGILLALNGMACVLPSGIEVSFNEVPPPNGEVVTFAVGEERFFSDGEEFVSMLFDGENWWCSDTANGEICQNFPVKVGFGEPDSTTIELLGNWHEVDASAIPTIPPPQEGGGTF